MFIASHDLFTVTRLLSTLDRSGCATRSPLGECSTGAGRGICRSSNKQRHFSIRLGRPEAESELNSAVSSHAGVFGLGPVSAQSQHWSPGRRFVAPDPSATLMTGVGPRSTRWRRRSRWRGLPSRAFPLCSRRRRGRNLAPWRSGLPVMQQRFQSLETNAPLPMSNLGECRPGKRNRQVGDCRDSAKTWQ